jgi:hypothetical protein
MSYRVSSFSVEVSWRSNVEFGGSFIVDREIKKINQFDACLIID